MRIPLVPTVLFAAFLATFLSVPGTLQAQVDETIDLSGSEDSYVISGMVSVMEDESGTMDLQQASSPEARGRFVAMEGRTPNFSFSDSVYWVRFSVQSAKADDQWLLEVAHPVLDHVTLFPPEGKAGGIVSGDRVPFTTREIPHRNYLFQIVSGPRPRTYYLRIQSKSSILLPMNLWHRSAFARKDHNEQYFLGLYYGMMLVMFLYNAFLFVSLQDRAYLYYVGYILSFGILYYLTTQGLAYEYLYPDSPMLANRVPVIVLITAFVSIIKFSQHYLNLRELFPRLRRIGDGLVMLSAPALLFVIFGDISPASRVASLMTPICLIYIIVAGIMAQIKGYRPARYFLVAWAVFILSGFTFILRGFGFLPNNFITQNGLQFGTAAEIVLLSLGLAYKIQLIREERERAFHQLEKTTDAYSRFVPREFLRFLGKDTITNVELGDQAQQDMAIMFADIRSFTSLSEQPSTSSIASCAAWDRSFVRTTASSTNTSATRSWRSSPAASMIASTPRWRCNARFVNTIATGSSAATSRFAWGSGSTPVR